MGDQHNDGHGWDRQIDSMPRQDRFTAPEKAVAQCVAQLEECSHSDVWARGWAERIDIEGLDMADDEKSIVAQIWGSWRKVPRDSVFAEFPMALGLRVSLTGKFYWNDWTSLLLEMNGFPAGLPETPGFLGKMRVSEDVLQEEWDKAQAALTAEWKHALRARKA